mgnify:CR=1 FL=1|tara:strand:+ start:310 stop:582 length:273 start_codon:yes stop_codon:yes gene_type:complete
MDKYKEVKISVRKVFHKYAEVTIYVPKEIENNDMLEYIYENETQWVDDLEKDLLEASYEYGWGLGGGMVDADSESEHRFDIQGVNFGGHM